MKLTFLKDNLGIKCELSLEKEEASDLKEFSLLEIYISGQKPLSYKLEDNKSENQLLLFEAYIDSSKFERLHNFKNLEEIIVRYVDIHGFPVVIHFNGRISFSGELLDNSISLTEYYK